MRDEKRLNMLKDKERLHMLKAKARLNMLKAKRIREAPRRQFGANKRHGEVVRARNIVDDINNRM